MILGLLFFLFMGLMLGLVGGGGSILTVPILVYIFKQDPIAATSTSLLIVGSVALVAGVQAYFKHAVNFRAVLLFAGPSFFGVLVARKWILPAMPEQLQLFGQYNIEKSAVVMLAFALVMLLAAVNMIRTKTTAVTASEGELSQRQNFKILLSGFAVGIVAGFVGAGGGFLIVPALALFLHIPTRIAIGSSLLIIFIQSTLGFLFSSDLHAVDWNFIALSIGVATLGALVGGRINSKISEQKLKLIFGYLVLVMGLFIFADYIIK